MARRGIDRSLAADVPSRHATGHSASGRWTRRRLPADRRAAGAAGGQHDHAASRRL